MEDGFTEVDSEITTDLSSDENPYAVAVKKEIKDQYMMGENLLVAPLFSHQKDRFVILPRGNWYNFYTGEYVGNGEVIHIENDLESIPLFVKDGGIIPMMPAIRQTKEWLENTPLEIRVYGEKDGAFTLYDDDGSSFDYQEGKYSIVNLIAHCADRSVPLLQLEP